MAVSMILRSRLLGVRCRLVAVRRRRAEMLLAMLWGVTLAGSGLRMVVMVLTLSRGGMPGGGLFWIDSVRAVM